MGNIVLQLWEPQATMSGDRTHFSHLLSKIVPKIFDTLCINRNIRQNVKDNCFWASRIASTLNTCMLLLTSRTNRLQMPRKRKVFLSNVFLISLFKVFPVFSFLSCLTKLGTVKKVWCLRKKETQPDIGLSKNATFFGTEVLNWPTLLWPLDIHPKLQQNLKTQEIASHFSSYELGQESSWSI